jgi:diaminopimelate epimerase
MQKTSQLIKFYKYHGLGNDFIILDLRNNTWLPDKKWLIKASNRNTGIGFDQALFITKDLPKIDNIPTYEYKIANANGTWANQCGNGARCIADWIIKTNPALSKIYLQTNDRAMLASKTNKLYTINMSKIQPGIDATGAQQELYSITTPIGTFDCKCFYIGNPHLVLNLSSPLTFSQRATIGEWCQTQSSIFPQGINVNFASLIAEHQIKLYTYERGAKETLSCASGACCTATAFQDWYNLRNQITVSMQLGDLAIEIKDNSIRQTGPIKFVFCGFIDKAL